MQASHLLHIQLTMPSQIALNEKRLLQVEMTKLTNLILNDLQMKSILKSVEMNFEGTVIIQILKHSAGSRF